MMSRDEIWWQKKVIFKLNGREKGFQILNNKYEIKYFAIFCAEHFFMGLEQFN